MPKRHWKPPLIVSKSDTALFDIRIFRYFSLPGLSKIFLDILSKTSAALRKVFSSFSSNDLTQSEQRLRDVAITAMLSKAKNLYTVIRNFIDLRLHELAMTYS